MLRRNREINIFSMSALDLFASALGAFVLLTLILLPYYLKTDASVAEALKQQQQQNTELQQQNTDMAQQNADMAQQNAELQKELENSVQFALLGITTQSKSFVLVIDMSGSMEAYAQIMLKTVERLLQPMKPDNAIQLLGYHDDDVTLHSWQTPYQLVTMSANQQASALDFAQQLSQQFGGSTPTHPALLEALKYPAEAIILLTDGAPNGKPDDIIADISRRNAGGKEIHCVALGSYRDNPGLVAFLEALAKANGGGFVGVAN